MSCTTATCAPEDGVCVDNTCSCNLWSYGDECAENLLLTPAGLAYRTAVALVLLLLLRHMTVRVVRSVQSGGSTRTPAFAAVVVAILATVARLGSVVTAVVGGSAVFILAALYMGLMGQAYIMIARMVYTVSKTAKNGMLAELRTFSPAVLVASAMIWLSTLGQIALFSVEEYDLGLQLNSLTAAALVFMVQIPLLIAAFRVKSLLAEFPERNEVMLTKLRMLTRVLTFFVLLTLAHVIVSQIVRPSADTIGYAALAVDAVRMWYLVAFPFITFRVWEPKGEQTGLRDWLLPCWPRRQQDDGKNIDMSL